MTRWRDPGRCNKGLPGVAELVRAKPSQWQVRRSCGRSTGKKRHSKDTKRSLKLLFSSGPKEV